MNAPIRFTDETSFMLADDTGEPDLRYGWSGPIPSKPDEPPQLMASVTFSEPSGNQALDADESATLALQVRNDGRGRATRVKLSLEPTIGLRGVTLEPAVLDVGDLSPGASWTGKATLRGAHDVSAGEWTVDARVEDHYHFDAPVIRTVLSTRAFRPPLLEVVRIEAEDGNANGLVERGEQLNLKIKIRNRGAGPARNLVATLKAGDSSILGLGPLETKVERLDPAAETTFQFSVLVNNSYAGPSELPLNLEMAAAFLNPAVRSPLAVSLGDSGRRIVEKRYKPTDTPQGPIEMDDVQDTGLGELPDRVPVDENAFAVVVGIEQYGDKVPEATFARRDATVFREYLARTLGVPTKQMVLLIDGKATAASMRKELGARLRDRIKPGRSDVYVFYAGHGTPDPSSRSANLVPSDGDPDYPADTCLPLPEVYRLLGALPARSVTVFLDACFTGVTGRGDVLALSREERPVGILPVAAPVPDRVTVLAAARNNQTSSASGERKHGLFSFFLMKGLRGDADLDQDRRITVGELAAYTRERVRDEAQAMNRRQEPDIQGTGGDRVLRVLPGPTRDAR